MFVHNLYAFLLCVNGFLKRSLQKYINRLHAKVNYRLKMLWSCVDVKKNIKIILDICKAFCSKILIAVGFIASEYWLVIIALGLRIHPLRTQQYLKS